MFDASQPESNAPLASAVDAVPSVELADLALKFKTHDADYYHAEYAVSGSDLIYHFWPPGEEERFYDPCFALQLEEAFSQILPSNASVNADFTDFEEASLRMREGAGMVPMKDFEKPEVLARETYYIRVVDAAKLPLYEEFLMRRVFTLIDQAVERSFT